MFAFFVFRLKILSAYQDTEGAMERGESVLFGTDGFSDAAFAVPSNY